MTEKEFMDKYGQKLNNEQLSAVRTIEGPVLLLAVPGSGKTTVLVHRLGYMMNVKGIAPENILTLTYTVAATRDMARRFDSDPSYTADTSRFGSAAAKAQQFDIMGKTALESIDFIRKELDSRGFDKLWKEVRDCE